MKASANGNTNSTAPIDPIAEKGAFFDLLRGTIAKAVANAPDELPTLLEMQHGAYYDKAFDLDKERQELLLISNRLRITASVDSGSSAGRPG